MNKTGHSVGVTWGEVPESNRHGDILSYTVTYHSATPGDPVKVKSIRTPTRFATLANLTKNTNYSITVMASNQGGNGPSSSPVFVVTSNDSKVYFLQAYVTRSILCRKNEGDCGYIHRPFLAHENLNVHKI